MMRFPIVVFTLVACAATAWAQDKIRMKDPTKQAPDNIRITRVSCKKIYFEYINSPGAEQNIETEQTASYEVDQGRKPNDLLRAEDLMKRGEFRDAVDAYNRVRGDSKQDAVFQDEARWGIIQAWANIGDGAKIAEAVDTLRKESSESYFTAPAYQLLGQVARDKGDKALLEKTMKDFDTAGKSLGMADWSKAVEIISASVLEAQGKMKEAAAVYKKYAAETKTDVGIDASLGLMRCLAAAGDWSALKGKADDILSNPKGKDTRLLMGAYLGRGDVMLFQEKKNKEALIEYMRVVDVLSPRLEGITETHVIALCRAAIACARFATESKDPDVKATYKGRAQDLVGEATKRFGKSASSDAAETEIKGIK